MSGARDKVLARVRQAEKTTVLPPRQSETLATAEFESRSIAECMERFQRETTALGMETFVEESAEAVRSRVASLAAGKRIFCWNPHLLPYELGASLSNVCSSLDARADQALAEVGVTGCDGAIAETGSLAVLSGKGKPRAAALLPAVHIAVVQRSDLFFSMGEFFLKNADKLKEASSCSFITGPSRTADIELTLTVGVHGPGRVIAIIGP